LQNCRTNWLTGVEEDMTMENNEVEVLSKQALDMFTAMSDKFEKDIGRVPTKDELGYIREKVMLHLFGFYPREVVVPEEDEKPETD